MNLQEWRTFAEQTKRPEGAIVACHTVVWRSLLDDPAFDRAMYLARTFEHGARTFYDRDDCSYTYVSPEEHQYNPGPFTFCNIPGDIPENAVMMAGRVRVRRLDTPAQ